jgi:hypothetical protein
VLSLHTAEGGKTGITAMVTGLAFLVSVFFAPIFASIPSWATGGTLVIVGALMVGKCVVVNSGFHMSSLIVHCLDDLYAVFLKSTGIALEMQSLLSSRSLSSH